MDCPCGCHKTAKPCGICCAETVKNFMKPAEAGDKSKELLEKYFKGKK